MLLFYALGVTFCLGQLPYPFISAEIHNSNYENVPNEVVSNLLKSIQKTKSGARCLQFLQYYACKTNTKICFVYSKESNIYGYLNNNNRVNHQDLSIHFIQIPKNKINLPFTYCYFNDNSLVVQGCTETQNAEVRAIMHEIHHYCEEVIQQKNTERLSTLNKYEIEEKLINGDEDCHQQLGCWFIGEFDILQEIFDKFVFRAYHHCLINGNQLYETNLEKLNTYLRNHQLDPNFIRPKYYECIKSDFRAANTIAFLQQEDFLLEHFALHVPSDGNDAIWAVMQAMPSKKDYSKDKFSIENEDEYQQMLKLRSKFAETVKNNGNIYSRFKENHHRIKVDDFSYIAKTINYNIIVIEPGDTRFKINIFTDDGSIPYQQDKLPKTDEKTVYIYYNGYNHYQPLQLFSKHDKNISLKKFFNDPAGTLNNFLKKKSDNDFLKKKFLNNNYKIEDVQGDGNCGIYAILCGLNAEANINNNIFLRNQIFPPNHRMRTNGAWLGMEDLSLVTSYLKNNYNRDLVIINTSPVNPNITNVIVPDDHIYTRYIDDHWVRYNNLDEAVNKNLNQPVILLYSSNHWQAVLPNENTTSKDTNFTTKRPKEKRFSLQIFTS